MSRAIPGASTTGEDKPELLAEHNMDYFGSNNTEMSFSKSFIALLGNKGLFDFYRNYYKEVYIVLSVSFWQFV